MTMISLIPEDLKNFLLKIEELGFVLCVVGGGPRDYLLLRKLSHDLDFEVRAHSIEELKNFFAKHAIDFNELPYQILRVDYKGFDLEFSLPRAEKPILDNKSHHHFSAILDKNLSYKEGFKRRDFTMNAIGLEFSFKNQTESIIDPYGGVSDLQNRMLKSISEDFYLDSVRFLRLVRFVVKYGFKVDKEIMDNLSKFDLSGLSKHHYLSEMQKSKNAGEFITQFNDWVKAFQLTPPAEFDFLSTLQLLKAATYDDLLSFSFLQGKGSEMSKFLGLPEKKLKDLESFFASYEAVKKLSADDLKKISEMKITEESDLDIFKHLKNLEDKKEWKNYFRGPLPISWSDWDRLTISSEVVNASPPKIRSYLKYHEAVKAKVKNG